MKFLQKKSIVEIPPASGSVSDTLNVTDKITNAPSIRLVQEMIGDSPSGGGGTSDSGSCIPQNGVIAFDGTEEEIPEGYELVDDPYLTLKQEIFDILYPIGRVIIDETGTDYSNYLGFTWEKTLKGVMPIGVNEDDTDFNTIGNTGGSKTHTQTINEMPKHTHGYSYADRSSTVWVSGDAGNGWLNRKSVSSTTNSAGGGQPMNIMNPYKVVAFWKRIA